MDPGKDDLLISPVCQSTHLLKDIFLRPAAHSSPGIWNDTVGTELVAPVLHFDVSSHMFRRAADGKPLIFPGSVYLDNAGRLLMFFFIFFKNISNLMLLIISQNDIHRHVFFQFRRVCLGVAACRHNNGVRIHLSGFMKHLPGFAVRNIRYRTGIDQVYVRLFPEGNNLVSRLFQKLLHGLCLICVYLASQIMKRRFFCHNIVLLFGKYWHPFTGIPEFTEI